MTERGMHNLGERTIKNFDALAITPARSILLMLAEVGFQSIQTPEVVRRAVSLSGTTLTIQGASYDLAEYEHLYVLGVGKCAVDSALELEAILGDRITEGVIIDVRPGEGLKHIRSLVGTHPYPSIDNTAHTKELLALAEKAGPHDLVLAIISGGGSTLLSQPKTHTPAEEATLVKHLFKKGATITELNTVRKHLSQARGGYLASATYPATLVTLIFSDVPGDDVHTIASGPTILDLSTRGDAVRILTKYDTEACGFSTDHLFDTPKDTELFRLVRNELILTNKIALEAIAVRARDVGYTATIVDTKMQGEARDVAKKIVERLHKEKPRTVLLYGGETTVTVHGPGKGGRNEEFAAAALLYIHDNELLTSLASDGHDNTEYAGGIADHHTLELARLRGLQPLDFIDTSDTFSLFSSLQQGIETGYTGANVADLVIAIQHGVE